MPFFSNYSQRGDRSGAFSQSRRVRGFVCLLSRKPLKMLTLSAKILFEIKPAKPHIVIGM